MRKESSTTSLRMALLLLLLSCGAASDAQHWRLDTVGRLPEGVANSAVVQAIVNDTPYLYSFGGIDSTKRYTGIHRKSWRYNISSGEVEALEAVPDSLGKIAMAVSRIDSILYLIGGYHVFASGAENSSSKMHRFNTKTNRFMSDGPDLIYPVDDHVQVVWKNRYIYVISGWMNTRNVAYVQIFDVRQNKWFEGTEIPNTSAYKAFGASGCIAGDTIFYLGGASDLGHFPIRPYLRMGAIDPQDFTSIKWRVQKTESEETVYRAASHALGGIPTWFGGSRETYNYDGIAYSTRRGVPTAKAIVQRVKQQNGAFLQFTHVEGLPMDLRGLGVLGDSAIYIVGGMQDGQKVSDLILLLTPTSPTSIRGDRSIMETSLQVYPIPSDERVYIRLNGGDVPGRRYGIYSQTGRLVRTGRTAPDSSISTALISDGLYFIRVEGEVVRLLVLH